MSFEILTGLLINTGVLSLCALLVTTAAVFSRISFFGIEDLQRAHWSNSFSLYAGLVFGVTAALLIFASLRIDTGAVVDARSAPLILSGIIGGPFGAVLAACIGGVARFAVGGPFVLGGVLSMFLYAFSGYVVGRMLRVDLSKPGMYPLGLLVLTSVFSTICVLPAFFIDNDFATSLNTAQTLFPMLLLKNPVGLLILGAALKLTFRVLSDREKLARVTTELETSNAQLSAENRRLLDFSAIVAHDLKSPAVRIASLTGMLREDLDEAKIALPASINEQIDFISGSAKSMTRLINDLVNYSFSQNSMSEPAPFDTGQKLREIVAHMAVPDGFGIKIADNIPRLNVPPEAFDIVVRNLVSNAIKHHDKEAGCIEISAQVDGQNALIKVSDDGPGVDEKYLERMFRPMERLRPDATEGSGLGLSFVTGLASAWGGSVRAYASGERGLSVVLKAPVA